MNDLISRQAAIDKTEMLYRDARDDANYMLIGYNHALSDMRAILKSLPSAQPEIVRCKDCVHYDLAKNGYNGHCTRQYAVFTAYDFCSYGERRGDADA